MHFVISRILEGTARHAGLLLAPVEGLAYGLILFCISGKKRAFYAVFAYFRRSVVTSVTLSSNLSNFEKISKKIFKKKYIKKTKNHKIKPKTSTTKKEKKVKNPKISKNVKKSQNKKKIKNQIFFIKSENVENIFFAEQKKM